mgnify:CR=1 FL=1
MKLSHLTDQAADVVRSLGLYATDVVTPTIRLGVTGLSRSGKTVFVTALVRNLIASGRLPFFDAQAEGRIERVILEPQPDDYVPRFRYEDHLACLAADPPVWPEGTRRISQLRLAIDYHATRMMRRMVEPAIGHARLRLDIVDYPGEWLIDLALLDQDYTSWSSAALTAVRLPHRNAFAADFLSFLAGLDSSAMLDESLARRGAELFTAFLRVCRDSEPAVTTLGPGRFLMPGDLEGSPLLTFFPIEAEAGRVPSGSLHEAMARRYESYRTHVVKPFFTTHFARIDRQIVLIDALAALNAGPQALADMSVAMTAVLKCFRPGANTLASRLFQRRVDKVLFAATKADHLHHTSHDRLEALTRAMVGEAVARAEFAGAEVDSMAIAAIRSTREGEARSGNGALPCIIGTPLAGQRVGEVSFDGRSETALFPGDLPPDPKSLLNAGQAARIKSDDVRVLTFRPPRLVLEMATGHRPAPPHIRLDRAIQFLIGDKLT